MHSGDRARRAILETLEMRRLLSAGDQDLAYGDNGFLTFRFGSTPYQFLPGSDPTGAATVVSMTSSGRSFMLRKFNNGLADTSAGPAGIISEESLPLSIPTGRQPVPSRIWLLSGGRTLIEFIFRSGVSSSNNGLFVRLTSDNQLDRTYGQGGGVYFSGRFPLETAQQGDKLLAIVGSHKVSRHHDDGTVDTTFGNRGFVNLSLSRKRLLVQPDGKILV